MPRISLGGCLFAISLALLVQLGEGLAESQNPEAKKGMTLEDIGRGLKSAAQNVEKEIPKIGPAIGETVKKITGKDSDKSSNQSSSKEKK